MDKPVSDVLLKLYEQSRVLNGEVTDKFNVNVFSHLMIQEFVNIIDASYEANVEAKNKAETPAEQLVFAGAIAQCEKMRINLKERFDLE